MSDAGQSYQWSMPNPVDFVPQRVVSLVPSLTLSLFDLNLGHRLVGVTDYCTRPEDRVKNIPKVGGTKNPDIAKIIALHPDLVLMNHEENRREDAEVLQQAGISLWVTEPRTVQDAINVLWEIMDVFDDASYSERVRIMEKTLDVVRLAMSSQPPIRTFVPIWRDPWMTFNQATYLHDVLQIFGLHNVFAERERQFPLKADLGEVDPLPTDSSRDMRYPRITLEEIVAAQPELILLPDEPYLFQEADAKELYQLDIPAAHLDNIYLIDGSLLSWHGTRFAFTLTELPPMVEDVHEKLGHTHEDKSD
ncbi:MAG: ABC transporter substrate-binding protein [Chloroflexi bacterium]|nr:ABC transporter substrate-binding protein [Chloroflexota bacterium]